MYLLVWFTFETYNQGYFSRKMFALAMSVVIFISEVNIIPRKWYKKVLFPRII